MGKRRAFEDYPRPALAVDLVLMTVRDGRLAVLLQRRPQPPEQGKWALPGGFVAIDEWLEDAAGRILASKARMKPAWLEQLYTFGDPRRDPRGRVVTVAYFALVAEADFADALRGGDELALADVEVAWKGEAGGTAQARLDGRCLPLAFDHAGILGTAVKRLRGKLDYSPIAFSLLPKRFTLRELQQVHEAILGRPLNKPAFRRRMLDRGWLEATGERETGASFRPAELYRYRKTEGEE